MFARRHSLDNEQLYGDATAAFLITIIVIIIFLSSFRFVENFSTFQLSSLTRMIIFRNSNNDSNKVHLN